MVAKKIALGFGIAIIFPMMIHYGVSTFVPRPKWRDYIVEEHRIHQDSTPEEKAEHVAERERLSNERRRKEKRFQTILFSVAVPLGMIAIIIGTFLPIQAVGTGLILGGIFSICNGFLNHWSELNDSLRFMSLLAALIVLIFIGYKKLDKSKTQ